MDQPTADFTGVAEVEICVFAADPTEDVEAAVTFLLLLVKVEVVVEPHDEPRGIVLPHRLQVLLDAAVVKGAVPRSLKVGIKFTKPSAHFLASSCGRREPKGVIFKEGKHLETSSISSGIAYRFAIEGERNDSLARTAGGRESTTEALRAGGDYILANVELSAAARVLVHKIGL